MEQPAALSEASRHGCISRCTQRTTFVGILMFVVFACAAFGADPPPNPEQPPVWTFATMHHHPWFTEVLVASVVGWLLGMVKGFASTADWLKKYWSNPPKLIIFALDLLVFVAVGSYFGTAIYDPHT